jgi:hypothetical protein
MQERVRGWEVVTLSPNKPEEYKTMNEQKPNIIVTAAEWIFDTIARVLIVLFDGLRKAVEHATPSLFALVATVLPYALPLPVAFMTAHSAQTFFSWDAWAAWTLGLGLEGLGLLVWVRLVDGVIARTSNEKIDDYVNFLALIAVAYEVVLILINVILAFQEGADIPYALTLFLVCLLPALSAAVYGIHRKETVYKLNVEASAAAAQREKERQERREDRLKAQELKLKYAAETDGAPRLSFRNKKK